MKKVIGYTLYGAHPIYIIGAIENSFLGKKYFPDWIIRFYYNNTVPKFIIKYLEKLDNVELIKEEDDLFDYRCVKWRFKGLIDNSVDIYVCRDVDSRLDSRDKICIDEWISSDYLFMSIIDDGGRGSIIGGGMWGVKGDPLNTNDIKEELHNSNSKYFQTTFYHKKTKEKKNDQHFLQDFVYPKIKHSYLYFYSEQYNREAFKNKYTECREIPLKKNKKTLALGCRCNNLNLGCSLLKIEPNFVSFYKLGKRQELDYQYLELKNLWKKNYPHLEI